MANALFAFNDRNAGRRAAHRLIEEGLQPAAVRLRPEEGAANDTLRRQVDEQVTGGLVSNLVDLFQGVLDWGSSPHDASSYEETVMRGGAVVSVDAKTEDERDTADEVMLAAGCNKHTDWSEAPTR